MNELERLNREIERLEAEQAREHDPVLNLVLEEMYEERDGLRDGKGVCTGS